MEEPRYPAGIKVVARLKKLHVILDSSNGS